MSDWALDQEVDLFGLERPSAEMLQTGSALVGHKLGTYTLREAARIIIEEWDGDALRQASATVLRENGPELKLADIKAAYAQSRAGRDGQQIAG